MTPLGGYCNQLCVQSISNSSNVASSFASVVAIDCELEELERDDFLFKRGMTWGRPDPTQLSEFMKDAYTKKLRYMDHEYTKKLVNFHKKNNKIATVSAVRPPLRFGELEITKNNAVKSFKEKSQTSISWINGGFFVLNLN